MTDSVMPRTSRATCNPEPSSGVAPATTSHGDAPGPHCGKPRASGPGGLRSPRRRPSAPGPGAGRGRLLGASTALAMLLIAACQNEDSTGAVDTSRLAGAAAGLPATTTPDRVPATAPSPATTTPPASQSPATSPPLAPSTGPAVRAGTGMAGKSGPGGGAEARAGAQTGAVGPGAPAPAPAQGAQPPAAQPPAAPPPAAQQPAGPPPAAPVTRAAAPPPPPAAPPQQQPASSACHPSYSGACLDPNASDYDCEGGSGNGPKYVRGPIEVRGSDPYQLDSDDDGVACE